MTISPPLNGLLCAALLKVRAKAAGQLPAFWGTLAREAWLNWMQPPAPSPWDPWPEEVPFTCSAFWLPDREEQVRLQEAGVPLAVPQGQICWLRVTLLDGTLFGALVPQALASPEAGRAAMPPLRLNGIPFELLELVVEPRSGSDEASWSGLTSYASLVKKSQQRPYSQLRRLTLEFDTPTAFSEEGQLGRRESVLLPEPVRVFEGLARRWQRFARPGLAEAIEMKALARYLAKRVRVEEYALHTERLHLHLAVQCGFVGRCTYRLPHQFENEQLLRQVHLLADYAFYAGVGHETTQGLGRARRPEG